MRFYIIYQNPGFCLKALKYLIDWSESTWPEFSASWGVTTAVSLFVVTHLDYTNKSCHVGLLTFSHYFWKTMAIKKEQNVSAHSLLQ